MTQKVKLEFVPQANYSAYTSVTNNLYSSFFNTYAVWLGTSRTIRIRRSFSLPQGTYHIMAVSTNPAKTMYKVNATPGKNTFGSLVIPSGSVIPPGGNVGILPATTSLTVGQDYPRYYGLYWGSPAQDDNVQWLSGATPYVGTLVYHPGGLFELDIAVDRESNPAGIASVISSVKNSGPIASLGGSSSYQELGGIVWTTRSPAADFVGRYTFTFPFRASIEAHVWGAGGAGAAGSSSFVETPPKGGDGSPGLYNTRTFTVEPGDSVEVFVGSAGQPSTALKGSPYDGGNTPGGTAGGSRVLVSGQAPQSYNGGRGGQGAREPLNVGGIQLANRSGGGTGGGGGGGASGILINDIPAIVAGGGGGGGGTGPAADNIASWNGRFGDSNARITKNATGKTPGDNRGENGRDVSIYDDAGGGGGGGGGGYPGGQGGRSRGSGDDGGSSSNFYSFRGGTGDSGECGGNFPVYAATTGAGTLYYDSRYGQGGAGGRGLSYEFFPGNRGNISYIPIPAQPGNPGTEGRVVLIVESTGLSSLKVGGQWRQIPEIFVKIGGVWKQINSFFVKINDQWRTIGGGGGVTPDANPDPTNYGSNNRPWS
jgi:hypothetical protein